MTWVDAPRNVFGVMKLRSECVTNAELQEHDIETGVEMICKTEDALWLGEAKQITEGL